MKLLQPSRTAAHEAEEPKTRRLAQSGKSREPLYRQLVQTLKNEILAGVYPVDAQLPTENELCARFDVSRHTVREALRQLRDDGLVSSRQGAGTTVLRQGSGQSYIQEISSINDLISFAADTRYDIDSIDMLESDGELAQRTAGQVGDKWMRIRGFRYSDAQATPFSWTEVLVNANYADIARLVRRHRGPIFELIEDMFDVRVGEVEQSFCTAPAPVELVTALGIEPEAFVVQVQRTYRLMSGEVAQVAFHYVPAERFFFSMKLRRVKS